MVSDTSLSLTARGARSLGAPLRLAAVRIIGSPGEHLLVAAGVAVTALALAGVLGGSLVARERAVQNAVRDLPDRERAVTAAWNGVSVRGSEYADLDPLAGRAVAPFRHGAPLVRAMLFRQTRVAGTLFDLAAITDPAPWVKLLAGRLPRPCTIRRCEVLRVGGDLRPIRRARGLPLVVVGRGKLTSALPLGLVQSPGAYGAVVETAHYFRGQTSPPFLLANGVRATAAMPALASVFRTYTWAVPVQPKDVHVWGVGRLLGRFAEQRNDLLAARDGFDLTAPVDALNDARARTAVAGERLLLVGSEIAVLLLAFAVLTAVGLRRDVDLEWGRLRQFGARRWQLAALVLAEIGAVALGGVAAGWALGGVAVAAIARNAHLSVSGTLDHSVAGWLAPPLALGAWLATTVVIVVTLRLGATRIGRFGVRASDLTGIVALATLLTIALTRGDVSAESLASERTDPLLVLLPGLGAYVVAVAIARGAGPIFRLLARASGSRGTSVRLAFIGLSRSADRATVVVTFLVIGIGLALLAADYRGTLQHAQVDQAAFRVPLDFTLREDLSRLVPVLAGIPPNRFRRLGQEADVVPVIRRSTGLQTASTSPLDVAVLGLPPPALTRLRGWRSDFAALSIRDIARRLAQGRTPPLGGVWLPADARVLRVWGRGRSDLVLGAVVETRQQDFVGFQLGQFTLSRHLLAARIPARARGGRLVELFVDQVGAAAETGEELRGVLELGPLVAEAPHRSVVVSRFSGWDGLGGATIEASGTPETRIRYIVTQAAQTRLRPHRAAAEPVPTLVSPAVARVAGRDRVFAVMVGDAQVLFQVVGVARFFPTIGPDSGFVVADREKLYAAANAADPGSATTSEVWVGAPPRHHGAEIARQLRQPPFSFLGLDSRRALERDLRSDPLAHGTLLVLATGAALTLFMGLVGLLLFTRFEFRDERGELFDLEVQGMTPSSLRRNLAIRTLVVVAFGSAGGVAAGLVLTKLVVDLVALTAEATTAYPPLVTVLAWPVALLTVAGAALAAGLAIAAAARAAFRAPVAGRHP